MHDAPHPDRGESRELPTYDKFEFGPRLSRYALVIPVLNEGERILSQLRALQEAGLAVDTILADGGSEDGSTAPDVVRSLGVRTLLVKRDAGALSAQLRMAFAEALDDGYDGIITMDGNGKDGLEGAMRIAAALDEGYDFVQGSRFRPGGHHKNTPVVRWIGLRFVHAPLLSLLARRWFTDTTNGFRGHSRRYLLHPEVQPFRSVFERYELLAYLSVRAAQLGLRTTEVPVSRVYPPAEATPTKIRGIKANLALLAVIGRLALGRYHPSSP